MTVPTINSFSHGISITGYRKALSLRVFNKFLLYFDYIRIPPLILGLRVVGKGHTEAFF